MNNIDYLATLQLFHCDPLSYITDLEGKLEITISLHAQAVNFKISGMTITFMLTLYSSTMHEAMLLYRGTLWI
jgi:hypothetical protein